MKPHFTRGQPASRAGAAVWFDAHCTACARLAGYLSEVRQAFPNYYAKPVAPFGETDAPLVIVGLAPGLHGANRTGRPFTGDHAGILLYDTLHRFGFASQASAISAGDGLRLRRCRITNAVKCLPPENKPLPIEIKRCNKYLSNEFKVLSKPKVILALGRIAHGAVLAALGLKGAAFAFAHGAEHALPTGACLIDSYHCSRYNTQTGRLTAEMFRAVFEQIRARVN